MSDDLKLHPAWKEAVKRFREEDFPPGTIVPHEWFYEALGMENPANITDDVAVHEKLQLEYMKAIMELRSTLLEEDLIDLQNKFGHGYTYVLVEEQTSRAMKDMTDDLRKSMRMTMKRLTFIRRDELTAPQAQENTDGQAHLARFRRLLAGKT